MGTNYVDAHKRWLIALDANKLIDQICWIINIRYNGCRCFCMGFCTSCSMFKSRWEYLLFSRHRFWLNISVLHLWGLVLDWNCTCRSSTGYSFGSNLWESSDIIISIINAFGSILDHNYLYIIKICVSINPVFAKFILLFVEHILSDYIF